MKKETVKKSKPKLPDKKQPLPKVKVKAAKKVKKPAEVVQPRLVGLEILRPPFGAHKKKKLLGRGSSSGHGKTSTRGVKGQTSRAGRDFYPGFEGGQMPLIRKIPKRGFSTVRFRKKYQAVNLRDFALIRETSLTPELLEQVGIVRDKNALIKVLGTGELTRALTVKAHAFSKKAKEIIEQAGGKAEVIDA